MSLHEILFKVMYYVFIRSHELIDFIDCVEEQIHRHLLIVNNGLKKISVWVLIGGHAFFYSKRVRGLIDFWLNFIGHSICSYACLFWHFDLLANDLKLKVANASAVFPSSFSDNNSADGKILIFLIRCRR